MLKKHCSQKLCFFNILFFCVLRFTSSHTHYHLSDHKLNPTLGINSVSIRLSISHKKWEKEQPIIRVFVRACCFLVLTIFHVTKLQLKYELKLKQFFFTALTNTNQFLCCSTKPVSRFSSTLNSIHPMEMPSL